MSAQIILITAAEYAGTEQFGDRINGRLVNSTLVTGRLAKTYTVYPYGGDPIHSVGSTVLVLERKV